MPGWLFAVVVVIICAAFSFFFTLLVYYIRKHRQRHAVYPRSTPLLKPETPLASSSSLSQEYSDSESQDLSRFSFGTLSVSATLGNLTDYQFLPSQKTLDDIRLSKQKSEEVPQLNLSKLRPEINKSSLF
jgi:hypothetical protein